MVDDAIKTSRRRDVRADHVSGLLNLGGEVDGGGAILLSQRQSGPDRGKAAAFIGTTTMSSASPPRAYLSQG